MMPLTKEDVEEIAAQIVSEMKQSHHVFWIDPEQHYNDHRDVREMVGSWQSAKGIFAKAFIGLVVIGTLVVAGAAVFKGLGK